MICWEVASTPKIKINKTDKKYKSTADTEDFQVHIYSLRMMNGIKVLAKKELTKLGL